jgi:hypothetical protein
MVTKNTNGKAEQPSWRYSLCSFPTSATQQPRLKSRTVNGHTYVLRKAMSHDLQYSVSRASRKKKGSLIDHGANGGIAGGNTRIIEHHPHRTVDINGIDNHQEITSIPIVTTGALLRKLNKRRCHSHHASVYLLPATKGQTIHSSCQLESFSKDVNEKSIHISGGLQRYSDRGRLCIPSQYYILSTMPCRLLACARSHQC